jgi:hypothetical protein
MGQTKFNSDWTCSECDTLQSKHNQWHDGNICESCNQTKEILAVRENLVEGFIDGIQILGLEIVIDGDHTNSEIDLGAVTITNEEREYIMDVVQSYRSFDNGQTTIKIDVTTKDDDVTFDECPFNINAVDLMVDNPRITIYFSCDENWESATLFVKGALGMVRALEIEMD